MKFDIVNNEDGPLARSLAQGKAAVGERNRRTEKEKEGGMSVGVEERLSNLEEHLCVRFGEFDTRLEIVFFYLLWGRQSVVRLTSSSRT